MKLSKLLWALAGLVVTTPAFAGTNLVTNGSFESTTTSGKQYFAVAAGDDVVAFALP